MRRAWYASSSTPLTSLCRIRCRNWWMKTPTWFFSTSEARVMSRYVYTYHWIWICSSWTSFHRNDILSILDKSTCQNRPWLKLMEVHNPCFRKKPVFVIWRRFFHCTLYGALDYSSFVPRYAAPLYVDMIKRTQVAVKQGPNDPPIKNPNDMFVDENPGELPSETKVFIGKVHIHDLE